MIALFAMNTLCGVSGPPYRRINRTTYLLAQASKPVLADGAQPLPVAWVSGQRRWRDEVRGSRLGVSEGARLRSEWALAGESEATDLVVW